MRSKLKEARKKAGMTQQQVAEHLGEHGICFKMRYNNSLIVCQNGHIYKRHKDGLYYLASTQISPSRRYLYVSIEQNGKQKLLSCHRIVAESFLTNNHNFPVVNHIDGNRENNSVDNLEWCSQEDNIHHMINMHKQKYLTNLKNARIKRGVSKNKIARDIGLKIGDYRDIENAIRNPTESEARKIECYFEEKIENLLAEVMEGAV